MRDISFQPCEECGNALDALCDVASMFQEFITVNALVEQLCSDCLVVLRIRMEES